MTSKARQGDEGQTSCGRTVTTKRAQLLTSLMLVCFGGRNTITGHERTTGTRSLSLTDSILKEGNVYCEQPTTVVRSVFERSKFGSKKQTPLFPVLEATGRYRTAYTACKMVGHIQKERQQQKRIVMRPMASTSSRERLCKLGEEIDGPS